ncbi:NAD(P)-dependent dehydrogenase (short-subunit alcohol dehydrogenase family) [Humitalea rosea]|uniref:NAD(P)-dependent dehydrogenase (Short-subunit alcohol dehydrogenase family) n=1 Tax=Humitalea rosea TaxID=990373 RepID=A0A2W7JF59_9PROT|nr:NAD(P)-dependent dehydrogenase (short-subunit alcohol dehydrogenase family) [Humitalea rosea]
MLHGASALVTGGASGLGLATAEALAAAGARVVVLDLNAEAAEAAAARLGGVAIAGDVADGPVMERAVATATALGPLRAAVACAGIAPAARLVGRNGAHDLALFERVIRVNLIGTFNLLRLAAAAMAANDLHGEERGVVVLTSSIAGTEGQGGQCAYAASKAGVMGLTLPAARDMATRGVRVVTLAPGMMETPLLATLPPAALEALRAMPLFPAGRLGTPAEFARLVMAVLDNPLLNGSVLRLDAGLRLPP